MKTISDYSIYCTEEQTRKSLVLGAPIEIQEFVGGELNDDWCYDITTNYACKIPTAEEMIGWLEEQGIRFSISNILHCHYEQGKTIMDNITYEISVSIADKSIKYEEDYSSRKEATLAAIDAALKELEYLDFCNWKKENNKE